MKKEIVLLVFGFLIVSMIFGVIAESSTPGNSSSGGGGGNSTSIKCGDTITQDTVLTNDIVNCSGYGLIIGADNITLDCNGHLIEGEK